MPLWVLLTYAYLVGFAVTACAGNLAEMRAGEPSGLHAPFVTAHNIPRSLALVLMAGPYLLFAEIRRCRQEEGLALMAALGGIAFVNFWALASGILLVELMSMIKGLFQ